MGRTTGKMLEGVQELDGISARDDEQNRLYHEEYGSQASQEDGERCAGAVYYSQKENDYLRAVCAL